MIVTVELAQTPVPTDVVLSNRVTVSPVRQDIVKSGVVSDVTLSVDDEPESVAAVMSGVPGAASAVVSMVIESEGDVGDSLPAGSVNVVVMT